MEDLTPDGDDDELDDLVIEDYGITDIGPIECGHCTRALPSITTAENTATCHSCGLDVHTKCRATTKCPATEISHDTSTSGAIVRSTKSKTTREVTSLDTLYARNAGPLNRPYRDLIEQLQCIFIKDFGYLRLGPRDRFAWLSPYTGNQHNRCLFTQLALVTLLKHSASGFPSRLVEPFLGSGQVFMNCRWLLDLLGLRTPQLVAGDLNVCLCSAWMGIRGSLGIEPSTFVSIYHAAACTWDGALVPVENDTSSDDEGSNEDDDEDDTTVTLDRETVRAAMEYYRSLVDTLNELLAHLRKVGDDFDSEVKLRVRIAHLYIYLNNRCINQSTYDLGTGVFSASCAPAKLAKLARLRRKELKALLEAVTAVSCMSLRFLQQDFALTTTKATLGDVVIYDCPFPKFSTDIPSLMASDVESIQALNRLSDGPKKEIERQPRTQSRYSFRSHDIQVSEVKLTWSKYPSQCLEDCARQANTMSPGGRYGSNDGGDLQYRILEDAVKRSIGKSSVILCNYALPHLLIWYSKLSYALFGEILPIFLFKRPGKGDELYLLAIWPSAHVLGNAGAQSARAYLEALFASYREFSQRISGNMSISKAECKKLFQ